MIEADEEQLHALLHDAEKLGRACLCIQSPRAVVNEDGSMEGFPIEAPLSCSLIQALPLVREWVEDEKPWGSVLVPIYRTEGLISPVLVTVSSSPMDECILQALKLLKAKKAKGDDPESSGWDIIFLE